MCPPTTSPLCACEPEVSSHEPISALHRHCLLGAGSVSTDKLFIPIEKLRGQWATAEPLRASALWVPTSLSYAFMLSVFVILVSFLAEHM